MTKNWLLATLAALWRWDYLSRDPLKFFDGSGCPLCVEDNFEVCVPRCHNCPLNNAGYWCNADASIFHQFREACERDDLADAAMFAGQLRDIIYGLLPKEFEF